MADGLVTVGSYTTVYEANLVKSRLEAFGIDARLMDAFTVNASWLWSNAVGGVKVQVPESSENEARLLLQTEPSDEQDVGRAPEAAIPCPACGCAETRFFLDKRGSLLTWLVLGLPVLPAVAKRACAGCGHKWKA